MPRYRITNFATDRPLGVYEAANEAEALNVYARARCFADFAAMVDNVKASARGPLGILAVTELPAEWSVTPMSKQEADALFHEARCEKAARALGWTKGGDCGGIVYNTSHYDSWKAAVSWGGGPDGAVYDNFTECAEAEGIEPATDAEMEPGPPEPPTLADVVKEALAYEAAAFDDDSEVNGGDMVQFFAAWRLRAREALTHSGNNETVAEPMKAESASAARKRRVARAREALARSGSL